MQLKAAERSERGGTPEAGQSAPQHPAPKTTDRRIADALAHRSRPASATLWGLLGFLIGAVFWHFIGFWGFVSQVVFSNHQPIEDRQTAQAGPHCIELVLDRTTGGVRGQACAQEAPELDESASAAKGDHLGNRHRLARGSRAVRLTSGER